MSITAGYWKRWVRSCVLRLAPNRSDFFFKHKALSIVAIYSLKSSTIANTFVSWGPKKWVNHPKDPNFQVLSRFSVGSLNYSWWISFIPHQLAETPGGAHPVAPWRASPGFDRRHPLRWRSSRPSVGCFPDSDGMSKSWQWIDWKDHIYIIIYIVYDMKWNDNMIWYDMIW